MRAGNGPSGTIPHTCNEGAACEGHGATSLDTAQDAPDAGDCGEDGPGSQAGSSLRSPGRSGVIAAMAATTARDV